MALSPMMQQYNEIKEKYKDCLLMFRLGDFYELFFDDALTASRELELTLTGRNCGLEEKAPMCGVPHHAVDSYIQRLVRNGYKVAICEQMEDPQATKGIVQRDVIRIVTPGTMDASESSDSDSNIYIASVYVGEIKTSVALSDISTGEFFCFDFEDTTGDILASELALYSPKEIISSSKCKEMVEDALNSAMLSAYVSYFDEPYFKYDACENAIMNHFEITSIMPLGIDGKDELAMSVGSLIMYLIDTQKQAPSQIKELIVKNRTNSMQLDRSTMRNLELLETLYDHDVHGSLFGVLNKTKTAMGARKLKSFLMEPLKDSAEINKRLDAVAELKSNQIISNNITNSLKHIYDFQRLTARIASGRANARDLIALKSTLAELPFILDELSNLDSELIRDIRNGIDDFGELHDRIERTLCEEPPFSITEGGLIKPFCSSELDDLKASIKESKEWIANLETTERERTGIKTIKVGFNKVFGYYIDVSKGMIDRVPEDYIRKQTLVNNERYITPELKEKENLVLTAESKINNLEYEIFKELRCSIEPYIAKLQSASSYVALLDVLIAFAKVATENNYVKPIVDDSDILDIKGGRHPVVEQIIGAGMFVSNDTKINTTDRSMLIITGPNMAGKSTYMRQTAIIVLMGQIGCFVPAESCHIGVVDRVFTRIGASDNLAYGQSTFYIEMSELANILRNSTSRSLIVLDEIGRGTSTFDGLSIAWATVEYLCKPGNNTRTMFATHYHELTTLCNQYKTVANLSVAVAEENNNIIFLHNIVEGPASKSYGIHVAKIAGIPAEIRNNAITKLRELEAGELKSDCKGEQLSFFAEPRLSDAADTKLEPVIETKIEYVKDPKADAAMELLSKIADTDLNVLTPLKALNLLAEIIDEAHKVGDSVD